MSGRLELLRRPAVWVTVATVLALGAGFALKSQCTYHEWTDSYQFRHYCYSDTLPLFGIRNLDQDALPYAEEFWEYPVGIGLFAGTVARLTDGVTAYLNLTFLLLSAAGALVAVALWRIGLHWSRVLVGAAGPAVVVHGLTNWDLLAVALAAWGILWWCRDRAFGAATLFGLGGAVKLYPAFFLPFLLVAALRAGDRAQVRSVLGGGVLGLGVPNAIVALRAPENWWAVWTFHGGRSPGLETPWESFIHFYGEQILPALDWGLGYTRFVSVAGALVFVVALVLLARRQWRVGMDPLLAGALLVLVFLLTNRVYSPQYTLWAVPLLAVFGAPWAPLIGFIVADLGHLLVLYQAFIPPQGQTGLDPSWQPLSRLLIDARWILLAWCAVAIARSHGVWPRRRGTEARAGPAPAVASGSTRTSTPA